MARWGILSTARIAEKFASAVAKSGSETVVAVASRDAARAESFAARYGLPAAYGSYEALLADPTIDAIYNPLPNGLHAEWSIAALAAGKHVLCEKPMACSEAEAQAMFAAAEANQRYLMEAFMYRFHPQTRRAVELIRSGAIGTVCEVRGHFSFTLSRPDDPRWRAELGGGALRDVGGYPISFARMIMGDRPISAAAHARFQDGVDIQLTGTLAFPGERFASVHCGFNQPRHQRVEVSGTEGVLMLDWPFNPSPDELTTIRLLRGVRQMEEETIAVEPADHFTLEAEAFARQIASQSPADDLLVMPWEETLDNHAATEALLTSAKSGQTITIAPRL